MQNLFLNAYQHYLVNDPKGVGYAIANIAVRITDNVQKQPKQQDTVIMTEWVQD